jgi:septum formation protein
LALLHLPFEVVDPSIVETIRQDRSPEDQARDFARCKARSCVDRCPDALILGSDTLIALETHVLGKPGNAEEARTMLRLLRGREHLICSAVALAGPGGVMLDDAMERVRVWMRPFSDADLDAYLATGESLGKAGAYSIQGAGGMLVERIDGDFPAVVGLPLRLVAKMLARHGIRGAIDVETIYKTKPYPNWARFSLP